MITRKVCGTKQERGKKPLCSSDNTLTPVGNLDKDRDTLQTMHPLWLTVTFHSVRTSKNIIPVQ